MQVCRQCSAQCDSAHRFCPDCGFRFVPRAGSSGDPLIGAGLPGGYVILEQIGDGGMGRVYRAEQSALGRTVAVKIVHSHLLADETTVARFITEARAASRLNHPNSLSVIDFGQTEAGQYYLVMEYLRGRDLARVVAEEGLLPFHRIIDILRQLLDALSEAHGLGVIHRDLKPDNIIVEPMRTGGDFVKVVDFGLAKVLNSGATSITAAGIVCGTPDYMSPEQVRGDELDARSDLYAVGVILFELLTGKLPFVANSPTQVLLMQMSAPPPDPRKVAAERDIPEVLADVTLRALAKSAAERFQSAEEFADALVRARTDMEAAAIRLSLPPPVSRVQCVSCRAMVPATQKFCGECGARVPPVQRASQPVLSPRLMPPDLPKLRSVQLPMPMIARDEDVVWLLERLEQTQQSMHAARIVGEPGMGKTRLLHEFASMAALEHHQVVRIGPDPWMAGVAYHALRRAIEELAALPADGGSRHRWGSVNELALDGLLEVFARREHTKKLDPLQRRRAVAAALRWAMQRACERSEGRRVVLIVDDLDRVDGASRNALGDVLDDPVCCPILVLGAHVPGCDARWPGAFPARILTGLTPVDAAELLGDGSLTEHLRNSAGQNLRPMYVEQLARLMKEGESTFPRKLGDLITLRLNRLPLNGRRILQAMAVLGARATPAELQALLGAKATEQTAQELVSRGLLVATNDGWSFAHPLIREIAEATTPSEVAKALHIQAAELAAAQSLPIEVRARHAMGSESIFEALLWLEQMGDQALQRAAPLDAIESFRRGLGFTQQHRLSLGLNDPSRAMIVFSRKLGSSLAQAGQLSEAEQVLTSTLSNLSEADVERARLLLALGHVAAASKRHAEAAGLFDEAGRLAHVLGASDVLETLSRELRPLGP